MKNSEAVLITGRISKADTDELDTFCKNRGISRSKAVSDAVLFYKDTKECIMCHTLNSPEGKKCSVCGEPLYTDEQIYRVSKEWTYSGISPDHFPETEKKALYKYMEEGFGLLPKLVIDRTRLDGKFFRIKMMLKTKNGIIVSPEKEISMAIVPETILNYLKNVENNKGKK